MAAAPRSAGAERSYWPLVPAVMAYSTVVTAVGFLAPLLLLMSEDLGVPPTEVAQLVGLTALPWGLLAPFCGSISDRFGRRPVLLAALFGMAMSTVAGAFVVGFGQLAVLRILTGAFGSGGPPTILAGLVEYYAPRQRGRVIGWINSSFSIAGLIGIPLTGAIGGIWGWRSAFLAVGLSLLVATLLLWGTYPRVPPPARTAENPLQAYRYVFGRPHLGTLLMSNLLERVAFMLVSLYVPSLLIRSYDLDPVSVAPPLALIAVGALLGGVGGGFLADRFDRVRLSATTLALSGLCGLALFLWPTHPGLSVAFGFGFGLLDAAGRPAFTAVLLGLVERHRGAINGLYAFSNQLGWALGAGLSGALLAAAGYTGLGQATLLATGAAAGLVLLARSAARPPAVPFRTPQLSSPGQPR